MWDEDGKDEDKDGDEGGDEGRARAGKVKRHNVNVDRHLVSPLYGTMSLKCVKNRTYFTADGCEPKQICECTRKWVEATTRTPGMILVLTPIKVR